MSHGDDANTKVPEVYTSLFALPRIVGREKELNKVIEALQGDDPPRMICVPGEGGIGKTRFLRELIKRLREGEEGGAYYVAANEVDLYQTTTHTRNGLADALYQASPFLEETRVKELMEEMQGLWAAGVAGQSAELRKEHLELFEKILAAACEERPVILFLDTAERWVYTWMDPENTSQKRFADAWEWLRDLLKRQNNLYIIIAGRPETATGKKAAEELKDDIKKEIPKLSVLEVTLGPLDENGVLEYFEVIQQIAEEHLNDPDTRKRKDAERIAAQLDAFSDEFKKKIAEWAEGNPIRLSLIIDYLRMGGSAPELKKIMTSGSSGKWHQAFFKYMENHPDKEIRNQFTIIKAMAQLPKGATLELLAALTGYSGKRLNEYLKKIESYTFIKKRATSLGDVHYFLHDELYFLLNDILKESEAELEENLNKIDDYYKDHIRCFLQEFSNEFRHAEEEGETWCPSSESMIEHYLERNNWLTERVYYDLKRDIFAGLRQRYRYTRHADLAGNVALDLALESEVLNFFDEPGAPSIPPEVKKTIDGMMAMRPVVRAWVEEKFDDVQKKADKLRQNQKFISNPHNLAILNIWEAYAKIITGKDLKDAQDLLNEAIIKTKECENKALVKEDFDTWRCKAILAFALRVLAYMQDNQGKLQEAIDNYRRAVKLWREVNLLVEVATTTRDLAYNLGRLGYFPEAEDMALNAIKLYRQLGVPGQVGLSLSALSSIYIAQRHYYLAADMANRALNIARCINFDRGIGLAYLALSEATRRKAGSSHILSQQEKFELLEDAESYARKSNKYLAKLHDKWYQIKSLIEFGCVIRDMIRFCKDCSERHIRNYYYESKRLLLKALSEAKAHNYRPLMADAIVNLAWLGFYVEDKGLIQKAEEMFRQEFPDWWQNGDAANPPKDKKKVASQEKFIWQQLGKLHVMKGARMYRKAMDEQDKLKRKKKESLSEELKKSLRDMGKLYARALEYSTVLGDNYGTLLSGKQYIFDQLKTFEAPELVEVCKGVREAEKDMNLVNKSAMRKFLEDRSLWYKEEEHVQG